MAKNHNGKLLAIIWMLVGSTLLASIFNIVLINYLVEIKRKVNVYLSC
ncbi:hypothetical protein [Metabacillus fastidiosus]|nr:hypothetical protein [Metabacillus fastidiosus]MEC2074602.1 hypothetical protein [Metabacillus fastidiosus]MEC2078665.1 hypothetical protein [Metabacillus fastidiosus]MED4462674.1 hypothetical protein [Metabacillus fastidiosus]